MAVAFELFELTGKRALVTGSSQGIGFALAQGLAEHGAEVVLNGRDAGKLDAAAAKLAAAGHDVSVAVFDVTQAQAVKEGVAAIEGNSGALDILVNNAACSSVRRSKNFPLRNGSNCSPPTFPAHFMSARLEVLIHRQARSAAFPHTTNAGVEESILQLHHSSGLRFELIDSSGTAVSDLSEAFAHTHCLVHARLMKPNTEDWRGWELRATDEFGCEIFTVPFASVLGKLH